MKPGYKTTEFWVTVLLMLATLAGGLSGLFDGTVATIATAAEAGLYAIARAITKKGATSEDLRAQVLEVLAASAATGGNRVPKHPGKTDVQPRAGA